MKSNYLQSYLAIFMLVLLAPITTASETNDKQFALDDSSFNCLTSMTKVRHFYVDNVNPENLNKTVEVAKVGSGVYPPGSVVQLIPGEVMVKHKPGFSPVTKDWEFFELDVDSGKTKIMKRGLYDINNKFGGNCFACHIKAKPEFDLVCETGHGCDPIPITRDMVKTIQKLDPRCEPRQKPNQEDLIQLKALKAILSPPV